MAYYFEVEAMVRGYHQSKEIWDAEVGEKLECQRETGNTHDIFAVAVLKSGAIADHVYVRTISTRRGTREHLWVWLVAIMFTVSWVNIPWFASQPRKPRKISPPKNTLYTVVLSKIFSESVLNKNSHMIP